MAFALAVNVHINVNDAAVRPFLEAFHRHGNSVRHLIVQVQQHFLPNHLADQRLFRHIRIGIVREIVRAFCRIAGQHLKQVLTAFVLAHRNGPHLIKDPQLLQLGCTHRQIRFGFQRIGFIDDCHRRPMAGANVRHQAQFRLVQLAVRLKQHQCHVHIADGGSGRFTHALAQFCAGLVNAGCVQQHILHRPAGNNARNAGAGRLRL